ncbi:MAG: L-histidine N(alpha)-methyltransferase [Chitinophagaceae bacterium]|nr:L-histidine N(alpha)-methyltransferase [Chitinophagaceae bacterium]
MMKGDAKAKSRVAILLQQYKKIRKHSEKLCKPLMTEDYVVQPVEFVSHYSNYDPQTGANKSFLVSEKSQTVSIQGEEIAFEKGEAIFMEISQKYDMETISKLAVESGFAESAVFADSLCYFADVLWEKKD